MERSLEGSFSCDIEVILHPRSTSAGKFPTTTAGGIAGSGCTTREIGTDRVSGIVGRETVLTSGVVVSSKR